MTQAQLNELIASATGDDVRDIRRLGFHLAIPIDDEWESDELDWPPQTVDWDAVEQSRNQAAQR
ncbi:hypothetical protein DTL21_00030 [Bremerella cremea]|uniref:Uncharacterized protein n=1 Tax=Blastopirellula marina TaxID=124 RepID=A0A2S8G7C1_9BACT|nr:MULTISPECIES: hypothetical protein [Pirellulaceae]PQO40365.1 hypothetical protein C5Y83_00030 [Blastopirellula marina]RCS51947.1 hypothetical protein DTL21_00030 [Bremerella cremea]